VTLYETVAGFALAIVIAFGCGVLIAELPVLRRVLMPYLVAVNAAPKIAFAPLLLVWFGFGMSSKVVMAALIAFFPLLVNVVAGIAAPTRKASTDAFARGIRVDDVRKGQASDAMSVIFGPPPRRSGGGAVVGTRGRRRRARSRYQADRLSTDVLLTFALIVLLSLMGIHFYTIEPIERRTVLDQPAAMTGGSVSSIEDQQRCNAIVIGISR
jgi:NitT/TauT family transport system permease protein